MRDVTAPAERAPAGAETLRAAVAAQWGVVPGLSAPAQSSLSGVVNQVGS